MDKDGDLVMLTDNSVLVRKLRELPALMCVQRKANKVVVTPDDLVRSNIDSFGNNIGQTTNRITSMFEVQAKFPKDSAEYKELDYRIKCGQLFQQNEIDRAKGIISKPMPRTWYDYHAIWKIEDSEKKAFYKSIVVDKKPYFMKYIYPALSKQYNTYIKNTNRNSLREFQMTVSDLKQIPKEKLTEQQLTFLKYFDRYLPVGTGSCVMNKICAKLENEFDSFIAKKSDHESFDYAILKNDSAYTKYQFNLIKKVYTNFNKKLRNYAIFTNYERVDEDVVTTKISMMKEDFEIQCNIACPNKDVLCNIILDLCYSKSTTKKFAWSMCGDEIIQNLLNKNGNELSFPMLSDDEEFLYCGEKFKTVTIKMEENECLY